MGVGYYVRASNDAYTDHGFFQVSAGVDNKRIEEVLRAVLDECKKLKDVKVDEEELNFVESESDNSDTEEKEKARITTKVDVWAYGLILNEILLISRSVNVSN